MELKDSHILITGANRGIGRGLAMIAARDGAHVHLGVRTQDDELVAELTKTGAASVTVWPCDLGSRAGVEDLLTRLQGREIDILINNAGQLTGGLLEEQPLDDIYSLVQVNIASLIHLTHGLLPGMIARGRGKIVNNASVSAFMHFPGASVYAASKAAVVAFTNSIGAETEGTGVTTLCLITPGVKTRMFGEIEEKYGKNLDTPSATISTTQYAEMVREAILLDLPVLEPKGATGIGLKVARYLPTVFRWEVRRRFSREPRGGKKN